jgi:hypothetical protein
MIGMCAWRILRESSRAGSGRRGGDLGIGFRRLRRQRGHGCRRLPFGFWRTSGYPLSQDDSAGGGEADRGDACARCFGSSTGAGRRPHQQQFVGQARRRHRLPGAASDFRPELFVSGEFHARKPEPEAYLRCLAHVGAAAEATLFVDDSARNVAGAKRAGLQAHLYRSPDGLNLRLGGFWTSDGAIHGPHFIEAAPFPPIAPGAVSVINACVHVPEEKGNFELALDLFERGRTR